MSTGVRIFVSALVSIVAYFLYDPHDYGDLFFIFFIIPAIFGVTLTLLTLISAYRQRTGAKNIIAAIAGALGVGIVLFSVPIGLLGLTGGEPPFVGVALVGLGVAAGLFFLRKRLRNFNQVGIK